MLSTGAWTYGIHKVTNFFQQLPHWAALLISDYCFIKHLPQPFNMTDPRRVNWLINHSELWICFLPAQRFTAFVDDVVIDNECYRFCPYNCAAHLHDTTFHSAPAWQRVFATHVTASQRRFRDWGGYPLHLRKTPGVLCYSCLTPH